MHDSKAVFDALALKQGDRFLDLGCGPGDYAVAAARIVGPSGEVAAMDKWEYIIDGLRETASSMGLQNICAIVADIAENLPVEDRSVDLCLVATVLHIFGLPAAEKTLFREIRRVLKPSGRLAVVECKKEEQPFGPPLHRRISPRELENSLIPLGFDRIDSRDLGYTYLMQFGVAGRPAGGGCRSHKKTCVAQKTSGGKL